MIPEHLKAQQKAANEAFCKLYNETVVNSPIRSEWNEAAARIKKICSNELILGLFEFDPSKEQLEKLKQILIEMINDGCSTTVALDAFFMAKEYKEMFDLLCIYQKSNNHWTKVVLVDRIARATLQLRIHFENNLKEKIKISVETPSTEIV